MRVTLSQPLISCTRSMSTPYSSPASMNVKYCSLASVAGLSATVAALAVLMISIPPKRPALDSRCVRRGRPAGRIGRRADQIGHIDDEGHCSVPQNGCTGDSHHRLEVGLQALDDDLLLREKVVDEHADARAVRLDDNEQPVFRAP